MKATDYLAMMLASSGVNVVFGYQGSSVAHIIDSLSSQPGIDFVESRNEQGSAFAANGFALASGKLGVAVACGGPGALNLIGGIANAYYDSIPSLFITGQVSQKERKKDLNLRQYGFQETDIVSIVKPIVKYSSSLEDVRDLPVKLEAAIQLAFEGRRGPVLLDIPHNIQNAELSDVHPIQPVSDNMEPDQRSDLFEDVADKIRESRRPVVLVGGGCSDVGLELWRSLDDCGIPVVTSYRGKNCFGNERSSFCGTIGVFGSRAANWAMKYSDFILCLGTRLDGRQTGYEPLQEVNKQNVVVIDIDTAELRKHSEDYCCIECDAEMALENILKMLKPRDFGEDWLQTVKGWCNRYPSQNEYAITEGVNPNRFLADLSDLAQLNANFSLDVGQNQLWANNSLNISSQRRLIQSAGLGAMGFAVPAGIGAYFANGNQTICIVGDGGMQMNLQELQVASEYKIPLKIFLMQNSGLGLIRDYQAKALGGRYCGSITGFSSPRYSAIADAFSMKYMMVNDNDSKGSLKAVLDDSDAWIVEVSLAQFSTSHPDPTYGSTLIDQSAVLPPVELERIRKEAYAIR